MPRRGPRGLALLALALCGGARTASAVHELYQSVNGTSAGSDAYSQVVQLVGKAAVADGTPERPYQVAMKTYSPFVENTAPGVTPTGYTVEYMNSVKLLIESKVGEPFNMEYYIQSNISGGDNALRQLYSGEFNFAISGITITPKRERIFTDFGEAHFPAGTGLLTRKPNEVPIITLLFDVFTSLSTARTLSMLATFSIIFANAMYFTERGQNEDFPPDDYAGGVTRGLWWSIVTVTTTGYGDTVPLTRAGRVAASLWMGVGLIIMASFSADVLSRLTASRVTGGISGPDNMRGYVCVTTVGSPWVDLCGGWGASVKKVVGSKAMLEMLESGKADVAAYDWPVLELWLLESNDRQKKFHMPWRSTTDGPFGPGFPHLAKVDTQVELPNGSMTTVEANSFDVLQRQIRLRELLNTGILYMSGSTDEAQLMARYFGGLSLDSLGSGGGDASDVLEPATVNDPYIIVGLIVLFMYMCLVVFHERGYRIHTEGGRFKIAYIPKPKTAILGEGELPHEHNGLARAHELWRLERKVERLTQLFENLEKRMVDAKLVTTRQSKGRDAVNAVMHANTFSLEAARKAGASPREERAPAPSGTLAGPHAMPAQHAGPHAVPAQHAGPHAVPGQHAGPHAVDRTTSLAPGQHEYVQHGPLEFMGMNGGTASPSQVAIGRFAPAPARGTGDAGADPPPHATTNNSWVVEPVNILAEEPTQPHDGPAAMSAAVPRGGGGVAPNQRGMASVAPWERP